VAAVPGTARARCASSGAKGALPGGRRSLVRVDIDPVEIGRVCRPPPASSPTPARPWPPVAATDQGHAPRGPELLHTLPDSA
jgi:hypothetical protein